MPSPDDDIPQPEPVPVRAPTLPPDFPDIPQNPSSELQPASDPPASPGKVAGTTPAPAEPETLRRKNARLATRLIRFWKNTRSYEM
jgi:hypothetical protein